MDILSFVLGYNKGKAQGGGGNAPATTDLFNGTVTGFAADASWGGAYIANSPTPFEIKEGETYCIEWDGTAYTCECKAAVLGGEIPILYLGNDALLGGTSTEPFTVAYFVNNQGIGFMATDTKPEHTIRIYQKAGGGISTDERVKYVKFMWGETELITYPVIVGDTVKDPVKAGLIGVPVKEPTIDTTYPFEGWSLADDNTADSDALINVTADRTVYVAFGEEARKYTATFYERSDEGDIFIESQQVVYGTQATPPDTFREGYEFMGWSPSDLTITGDTDFYGSWKLDQGWLVAMESFGGTQASYVPKYSPDGTRLFYVSYAANTYTLRMYDTTTQPYTPLYSASLYSNRVYDLDISADGKWLVLAGGSGSSTSLASTFKIFKINESSLTNYTSVIPSITLETSSASFSAAFSPDGTKLVVGHGKTVHVFNIISGTWTHTQIPTTLDNYCDFVQMSPDNTKIIAMSRGRTGQTMYVFDATNNYAEVTTEYFEAVNTGEISALNACGNMMIYSPDGKYLACAYKGYYNYTNTNTELKIYDTTTKPFTLVKTAKDVSNVDNGDIRGIAYSADGFLLALARTASPYLEVYDTATWELKEAPLVPVEQSSGCCAFSQNNHLFVGATDSSTGKISLYRVTK